jgi:vomeronasal1 receptor
LHKHHKHIFFLHSFRFANNSSPEIRATLAVLTLMNCFLFFYWADFIFSFYIDSILAHESIILNIKIFLGFPYASLSPFVLISRDGSLVKCWHQEVEEAATHTKH